MKRNLEKNNRIQKGVMALCAITILLGVLFCASEKADDPMKDITNLLLLNSLSQASRPSSTS